MNTKILISGATGTVGSFLVEELRSLDTDFTAMVRSDESAKKLRDKGIKTVFGDFADPDSLKHALAGFDKVFLLSGVVENQCVLEGNVVLAAKVNSIKQIVKLSAIGTSLESPIQLAREHAKTEALIRESGIAHTFLHPTSFMQNLFMQIPAIKGEKSIYAPFGDAAISLVDARDIAAIAASVLSENGHEGKTYVITGPRAVTFYEVAEAISAATDQIISYVPIGLEEVKKGMIQAGTPEWLAEDLTLLNRIFSEGHGAEVSNHTEQILGRKGMTIHDFAQDFAFLFK